MSKTFDGTPPREARVSTFATSAKATAVLTACALALGACASRDHRGPGGAGFAGQVMAPPIALLFTDYDRDHDRRITQAELKAGAAQSFAEADADKSGVIPALEFQLWTEKALGSKDALPGFLAFDADMSDTITEEEFIKALTREFTRLDANKDSVLERSELVAVGAAPAQARFRGTDEGGFEDRGRGGGMPRGDGDGD